MSSNSDMVKVAEWSDLFRFRPMANRPDRIAARNDFERNRTYIVTTIIEEPYIMLKKSKNDPNQAIEEKDKYIGYCKDLADILAKRLGIKCKLLFFFFIFHSCCILHALQNSCCPMQSACCKKKNKSNMNHDHI